MRFRPAPAAILATLAVSACATAASPPAPHMLAAVTPTEQFAIEVTQVVDEILLAPHGALSPAQGAALSDLAVRWREAGESPILVEGPAAGPGAGTALAAARALEAYGVPGGSVQLKAGPDSAEAPSPVRVGFGRLAAVGPNCAGLWDDVTRTKDNLPYSGFGCAVTANMAAQIADPRDLLRARAVTPADGDRRASMLEKYRKGEPTATERSADERGVVSRTIQ